MFRGRSIEINEFKSQQKFERGPFQDIIFLVLFVSMTCGMVVHLGVSIKANLFSHVVAHQESTPTMSLLWPYMMYLAGVSLSMVVCVMLWWMMLGCSPKALTWISLFLPVVVLAPTILLPIILLIYYYFIWNYIPFTIELIRAAAEVFHRNKSLIIYGLLTAFLQICWGVFAIFNFLAITERFQTQQGDILSKGDVTCPYLDDNIRSQECKRAELVMKLTGLLLLFCYLWGSAVIAGIFHVTCSMTMAMWYFNDFASPALAFGRASTTQLGTICMGSLFMAIIHFLRYLLDALTKDAKGDRNFIGILIKPIIDILVWLAEVFNKATLSIVAIYGMRYMAAAAETVKLFEGAGLKLLLNSDIVSTVATMGIVIGACVGGASGAFFGIKFIVDPSSVHEPTQIAISALVGFCIGAQLMSLCGAVLESLTSTLLVCFAEEPKRLEERHAETYEKVTEKIAILQPQPDVDPQV